MTIHPTLARLDRLADRLRADDGVVAVLGLGSAGVEHDRFDEHSDIDFFVIVATAADKERLLAGTAWLAGLGGEVAYSFVNDPNGRKALLEDGLFLEYAVLTPAELDAIPTSGARVVWQRPGAALEVRDAAPRPALDTIEFHLNEALTNLFVGLHRELRGERLTAMRFIQVYAVDRVLALHRLTHPWHQRDPFEGTRRAERNADLPLAEMAPGYAANVAAAGAILGWLAAHHRADPVIVRAIEGLLVQAVVTM